MAKAGITARETPGTPTFDIPISIAEMTRTVHCKTEKSKQNEEITGIIYREMMP
jgi:hypothetical protein